MMRRKVLNRYAESKKKMPGIHDYDDILSMKRPEPKYHPRMPLADRAAQFAPFAALTGYSEVIREVGRTTEEKRVLDEREKERINRKLITLQSRISLKPFIVVTYFAPDEKKDGGSYLTVNGNLNKIDTYENKLILTNGVKIDFDEIIELRYS